MWAHLALTTGLAKLTSAQLSMVLVGIFIAAMLLGAIADSLLRNAGCGMFLNGLLILVGFVVTIILLNQFYQQVRLLNPMITIVSGISGAFIGLILGIIGKALVARD